MPNYWPGTSKGGSVSGLGLGNAGVLTVTLTCATGIVDLPQAFWAALI